MRRFARSTPAWRWAVIAASWVALAHSLWFAWAFFQATPWLDMWDWVGEFRAWPEGRFGWQNLIAEHNDHRIATARVLFLFDTLFFHMSGRFIATVNMGLLCVLGLLLHRVWRTKPVIGTSADLPAVFFVAVTASVCQWENLVTPFQVQFALLLVFATLTTVLLVYGTSSGLSQRLSRAALLAAGLGYALAAFSMAGGVLLLPILLVLLWARRASLSSASFLIAPAGLAILLFFHDYAWHSFGVPLKIAGSTVPLIAFRMVGVGLEFLGSAFAGLGGGAAIVAGALGLLVLGITAWRLWRTDRRLTSAETVFMALAAFVVANALAAARLRGYFSIWGGLASRYAALSLLFFISLAGAAAHAGWNALSVHRATERRAGAIGGVLAPGLALLALAAFNLPVTFALQAASLQRALQTAGTTLQQRVYAPSRISILNPFGLERVIGNVRYAEHYRLSMFATSGRPPAHIRDMLRQLDDLKLPACLGAVDMFYRLDARRAVLRGWLATPNPDETVQWVDLRNSDGHSVAVLPAQELRDERPLGANHAPIMGVFVGFTGTVSDGALILIGIPSSGQPCRLAVRGPGPGRIQALPDQQPPTLAILELSHAPAWSKVPFSDKRHNHLTLWKGATGAGASIWTTAAKPEGETGSLTFRVVSPSPGLGLALPFTAGPDKDGQALVFKADDGARIEMPIPADTQSGQWRLAALPAEWLAHHTGAFTITARDEGSGAGQWLAVGAPVALSLDPDAADLDHDQPAGGWPVFTLIPAG